MQKAKSEVNTMKNRIRCSECPFMKIPYRTKENWLNRGNTRGACYCTHRDVYEAFKVMFPFSNHAVGFICFTDGGGDIPKTKGTPRWCPRRILNIPVEIEAAGADKVIESRKPLGMFYTQDGEKYIGIDNKTGIAKTAYFDSKSKCVNWLKKSQK